MWYLCIHYLKVVLFVFPHNHSSRQTTMEPICWHTHKRFFFIYRVHVTEWYYSQPSIVLLRRLTLIMNEGYKTVDWIFQAARVNLLRLTDLNFVKQVWFEMY